MIVDSYERVFERRLAVICFGPNGDNRKIARLLNGNLAVGGVEGNRTPPGSSGQ